MKLKLLILISLWLFSCSSDQEIPENITDPYALEVLNDLNEMSKQSRLSIIRNIQTGETVESSELLIDTIKEQTNKLKVLKDEYAGFLSLNTEELTKTMELTVDSGGGYESRNYSNKDTMAFLQEFKIIKSNHKIQGYFWKTRQRGWLVDRDIDRFYLPGKGYDIQIAENTWWSAPERITIHAEVLGPNNVR
jgi:hypothetical protein